MDRRLAATVPLVLLLGALGAGADHVQQDGGLAVSFDHRAGNEWWVEVTLGGPDAARVAQVRAMDTGGPWVQLEKRSWGAWAGSFRVEPGHDVRFEAVASDGSRTQSCWFSHPQGLERCATAPTPVATFDHKGGNEWWVQVQVSGAPARVQAMDTGGAWVELARKDWGDWAASFRIEPGHDVRFRALVDGDWVESCWFTHPGGRTPGGGETCGGGGSTPAEGFDASFRPKAGNAWWVEVFVDADRPLAGVDARADGGAWVPLEKRSWGAWARSFHVPDGSIVEFRARAADGSTDVSERYRWPSATRVDGGEPAPGTVDVAFAPKAGNAWWVEAIVVADGQPVTRVEARAAGGAWHEMAYREWGAWAASFHVPAGAQVEFRATTPDGTDVSHRFTWPDARPIGSAGAWPEEGSYARYDVTTQLAPGVMEQRYIDHVYHDGRWWHHVAGHFDDGHQRQEIAQWGHDAPPRCATEVAPGSAGGCYGVTVLRKDAEATHREGDPFTAATWYGEHVPDCRCNNDHAEWDQATGLVVGHYNSGTTWVDRLLLDTDAPMRAA